jgi:Na+/H+-dicarboxylate symporter
LASRTWGDSSALGRIGGRALAWFIVASLISIGLGLVMVNLFQPVLAHPSPTLQAATAAVGEVRN